MLFRPRIAVPILRSEQFGEPSTRSRGRPGLESDPARDGQFDFRSRSGAGSIPCCGEHVGYYPATDLVPQIGQRTQSSYELDLVLRDFKAELQTIESILDAVQSCTIANLDHVKHLLDPGRLVHELWNSASFQSDAFHTS